MKYCEWCGKSTTNKPVHVAQTPILEWIEERINKIGRKQIWGENSDWSKLEMDSDFEAELLVYDQLLSTVSKSTVCNRCLKEDQRMWEKYYDDDSGDDDGGMFVVVEE